MTAIKEHLSHHPRHMLGCGVAGLILVTGVVLSIPAVAIVGALGCGAMCFSMIRMMLTVGRPH
jgi:hypothetical protein